MAYYLGIDGGGTKTTCAVGDDDGLLATVTAGPSNIVRVGEAEARRSLHQAIAQGCAAAGISPSQVTRACIGAAGAASDKTAAAIRRIAAEVLIAQVIVTADMEIALEAAFPLSPGIVVIAGTGSIAYGRDGQGNAARSGGWGFAISDEGSAHWIGRHAVAAIFRAWDAGSISHPQNARTLPRERNGCADSMLPLLHAVQQNWNAHSIDDLVRVANANPAPNFAALLPAVLACDHAGDQLCQGVLSQAGGELAQLAAIVSGRLFPPSWAQQVPLAMVGGVFRYSNVVRDIFYSEIKRLDSRLTALSQVVEPVEGALRKARSA